VGQDRICDRVGNAAGAATYTTRSSAVAESVSVVAQSVAAEPNLSALTFIRCANRTAAADTFSCAVPIAVVVGVANGHAGGRAAERVSANAAACV